MLCEKCKTKEGFYNSKLKHNLPLKLCFECWIELEKECKEYIRFGLEEFLRKRKIEFNRDVLNSIKTKEEIETQQQTQK